MPAACFLNPAECRSAPVTHLKSLHAANLMLQVCQAVEADIQGFELAEAVKP